MELFSIRIQRTFQLVSTIYYGERISNIHKKTLHYIAQEKGIAEYDMYIDCGSLKYEMLYKPSQF